MLFCGCGGLVVVVVGVGEGLCPAGTIQHRKEGQQHSLVQHVSGCLVTHSIALSHVTCMVTIVGIGFGLWHRTLYTFLCQYLKRLKVVKYCKKKYQTSRNLEKYF